MKSEPDSKGTTNRAKAFIREKYIGVEKFPDSYVGAHISAEQLKEKYGLREYRRISLIVNDVLNRPNKGPIVSKKIHC